MATMNASCMRTAYVLLLCGLPGSGKSTLARAMKESNEDAPLLDRILHIEYDSVARDIIRHHNTTTTASNHSDGVFDEQSLTAWRSSRKMALEQLHHELELHFKNDNDTPSRLLIIMDDNFQLRSMRKNVHHICQAHANQRLYFCILWLDIPQQECLSRNRLRSIPNRVPDDVIRAMSFEVPDPQKASWEDGWIHCKDAKNVSLELVLQQSQLVPPPVDPEILEQERRKTRESLLHTYDSYLRAWVGAVARIRQSDVGKANAARKSVLQKLRKVQDTKDSATLIMQWFQEQTGVSDWNEEERAQLTSAMRSSLDQ